MNNLRKSSQLAEDGKMARGLQLLMRANFGVRITVTPRRTTRGVEFKITCPEKYLPFIIGRRARMVKMITYGTGAFQARNGKAKFHFISN